jgi:DNA-binding transcriptional ArsR family regulator
MTGEGDESGFDWTRLVPHLVHPLKVSIVEALWWVGEPLSASDLTKMIGDIDYGISHVSYHMVRLARAGGLEVVRSRHVRGSLEKFYFFTPAAAGPAR